MDTYLDLFVHLWDSPGQQFFYTTSKPQNSVLRLLQVQIPNRPHTNVTLFEQTCKLTGEVFQTLAGVPSFSTAAATVIPARPRIAQVNLSLTVVAGEPSRTSAAQAVNGMDRPEEYRFRSYERRRAVELQHRNAFHIVLAGLPQANVVVEWKDALAGDLLQ